MKWCLSLVKRMKVFLLVFEANELGKEIYKESISIKYWSILTKPLHKLLMMD